MRFHLFLILQTHILVLARKRGVRQPRQMHSSSRTLELQTDIFQRQTRISEHTADQGGESEHLIVNIPSRKTGRERGGRKATGKKRSTSRGSSAKSPSMMEPVLDIKIPVRTLSNLCKVNQQGSFGAPRGDKHVISYVYQLEVEPGTMLQQVEENIIPSVEAATVNSMIPSMFESLCGSFRKLQLELVQPPEPRYLGISTAPEDAILEDADCDRIFLQPCYVVNGHITAYSVGKSLEEVEDELSTFLDIAFSFGNFASTITGVDGVAFRSIETGSFTSNPTPLQTLGLVIPPISPIFTSPNFPTPSVESQTPNPTPIPAQTQPTTLILPSQTQPTLLPPPPTKQPSLLPPSSPSKQPPLTQPTLSPTRTPTSLPTREIANENGVDEMSSSGDTVGGLSAWWRWLLLCLIIVIMVVAIYVVYRGCPGKSNKQHASFEEEEDDY